MNNRKLNEIKLAVIDTETTGLSVNDHEIIEIGVIIYDQEKDDIVKTWETKIAPQHIETASPEALEINGYAYHPGLYTGNLKSAMIKFNSLVKGCLIMGQNVSFDLDFLHAALKQLDMKPTFSRRYLDLMGLAWFAVKDTDCPGISLANLCDHFDISNVGSHSALVDCERSLAVYRKLNEQVGSKREV